MDFRECVGCHHRQPLDFVGVACPNCAAAKWLVSGLTKMPARADPVTHQDIIDKAQAELTEAIRLDAADGLLVPVDLSANGVVMGKMSPREAEVTPEMIAAGLTEYYAEGDGEDTGSIVAIYRVMHAAAPVAPTWDEIGQLVGERDRALSRASHAMENWTAAVRERDEARQNSDEWYHRWLRLEAQCETRVAEIATLRTELTAARDTIAKLTSSAVPDTPSVAPNPFREFPGDRRRIGG